MVSSVHFRRLQKLTSTPIFTLIVSVLIIIGLIVTAVLIRPKSKDISTAIITPLVKQDLVAGLVSLPDEATLSSSILFEYRLRHKQPFQVMNIDSTGKLMELPLTSSTSAQVVIFVTNSLPTQDDTRRLYEYWKDLTQSSSAFESLWASDSHIGVLFPDSTLVVFGNTPPQDGLSSLQQIRSHTTITLSGSIIDLRFDKPVISQNQISIE